MSVVRRVIKGQKFWVIDRTFRSRDGLVERYRRVAQVQTRPAAEAEERHIIDYWTLHGTIAPLMKPERRSKAVPKPERTPTWADAVKHFTDVKLPKLKPSTRNGYAMLLTAPGMARWSGVPLVEITRQAIDGWDTDLKKRGIADSTRRNHHIMLRSVLRSVAPIDGAPGLLLQSLPSFPRLPKVGTKEPMAVEPGALNKLLGEADGERQPVWAARRKRARLAFALAALGGLRASEIRGLRRGDVDLKRRRIMIRIARVVGEEAPPKSGHERVVPIAPLLMTMLEAACEGLAHDAYVATTHDGTPWSDGGLWAALQRATARLKLPKAKVHALRHAFTERLFEVKTDARTVQKLLGHHSLEVTQRYARHDFDRATAAVDSAFGVVG